MKTAKEILSKYFTLDIVKPETVALVVKAMDEYAEQEKTKVKNLVKPDVSRSKSAAWKEGYDASSKGYDNNVYQGHHGTERHKEWIAGWIERETEKDNEI